MSNKNKELKGQISLLDIIAANEDTFKKYSVDEMAEEERNTHIREVTSMELPMNWSNVFNSDTRTQNVHTDSIPDALILSLTELGSVNIEYISSITGADYKTIINTLKGSIYQNPDTWNECFYHGWETAGEYLSGNLRRKWNAAKAANEKFKGYFSENITVIEKVLPPEIAAKDIYITLGSPWVPPDIIDDFIVHLFGDFKRYCKDNYMKQRMSRFSKTIHDEITGTWEIPNKSRYHHSVAVSQTYGTDRIEALYIIEKTLNMKTVIVTDEIFSSSASGMKHVINKTETAAALEKQQKLIKAFQDWVWSDEYRKKRLETIFENNFSCVRRRIFDGSFLNFPTMSGSIQLHPHQKDAVARIIFMPNTLLAHDVGAGKTYVMIAAGQELRRMGLSSKNMYVVPNNIVGQWKKLFFEMYPDANILCIEPKSFTPNKRKAVLKRIRDEDFDGIIIAYSCFEMIPLSREYYRQELEEKKGEITDLLRQKSKATSKLRKKLKAVEKSLSEICSSADNTYDTICFDALDITRLFVDEAHNFKNVPIETKVDKVLGINSNGSKKCRNMMDKVHMVQKKNGGKGVVFATGTPITNSVTDAFIMQQYLQNDELALIGLQSFDAWIGMFAERTTEFEIDVDTNKYRLTTRFSKFHNIPELTSLLSSIADFYTLDASAGIPAFDGYSDVLIPKTRALAAYLDDISQRADDVRSGNVSPKEDNMLKITTDGRKAALDLRLVDPLAPIDPASKVMRCAENVADIYFKTMQSKSTQLIFCDTSIPKAEFNIYDEVKVNLIKFGIPESQIVFIHDAETESRRSQLFKNVRNGDIRILIGSTFKLGLGVNIQNRLIALHHIDVPWKPSDMTQREGRILRQGNSNSKVSIYRYITEGSFDAYSWQLLETKQRFIAAILSGTIDERSVSDIENVVLDYAEVKALAVGNPLIKERVEAVNELTRYTSLQRKLTESRFEMEKELLELPGKIQNQLDNIQKCSDDLRYCLRLKNENSAEAGIGVKREKSEERKELREYIGRSVRNHILEIQEKFLINYRGFDIILPANMTKEKPYVWLVRQGRYYVALGSTDIGNLTRIDNYLNSLDKHFEELKSNLNRLKERQAALNKELSNNDSFADKIEEFKKKVKELDEKLWGMKNEPRE